jgi:hypothetical protein
MARLDLRHNNAATIPNKVPHMLQNRGSHTILCCGTEVGSSRVMKGIRSLRTSLVCGLTDIPIPISALPMVQSGSL